MSVQDNGGEPVVRIETTTDINKHNVIRVLEAMLEQAQRGDIAAVAVSFVRRDRVSASQAWSSSDCVPALIGAVAVTQVAMIEHAISVAVGGVV